MRVAVFTDNDFDKVNGVTTALTALLRHAPGDIEPRIYTAATLGLDRPDYFALPSRSTPIPFYGEMRMYWPAWRRFADRVRADGVEVLHLTTPGPVGLAALWVRRQTALPLVGSFHTDLEAYTTRLSGSARLGAWMGRYLHWMYGHCRRTLVPSTATRDLLLARGGREDRLVIWPRGVDTALFTPSRRSARLRDEWRVSDERPALIYVGRLSPEKDVLRLPVLSAALHARGLAHRLVLVGDGPARGDLAAACPDAVFTGTLGREAVADAFASADIFVFPSATDTAGNVVLEAQAAGLPVVVSTHGGPRENMAADRTGVICGDESGEWTASVAMLLMSTRRRRCMGEAARAYALRRRWDIALAPLYDTYREVGTVPLTRTEAAACHA